MDLYRLIKDSENPLCSHMEDAKLITELVSAIILGKIESNSFEQSKKLYKKYD